MNPTLDESNATFVTSDASDANLQGTRKLLACNLCHASLQRDIDSWRCVNCQNVLVEIEGVIITSSQIEKKFFDVEHEHMMSNQKEQGTQDVFYAEQCNMLLSAVLSKSHGLVVDIGCGPTLPYSLPIGWEIIGVDPSLESIQKNTNVTLRIQAKAQSLPIADNVADIVVCFYSIHHMTKSTVSENRISVQKALLEMKRILKSDGQVIIFEVNPYLPFLIFQRIFWRLAKVVLGSRLDAFFWGKAELPVLVQQIWKGVKVENEEFFAPRGSTFPPVINLPTLRIPRALYPFSIRSFKITNGR